MRPTFMRRALCGLALALVVTACSSSGSTPIEHSGPPEPAPLQSGIPAATSSNILGMWKPSGPHGQTKLGFVKFNANGTWAGSDGCNAVNGDYELGESGAITATSGPST